MSCQNVCEGAQNAYRRMIFEDERARPEDQLAFVLHLGDFVYEVVRLPGGPARAASRYDRRLRDVVRYPDGEKVAELPRRRRRSRDYRALYRAYLQDPDLQDARARWPFVSDVGQPRVLVAGLAVVPAASDGKVRPAQTRKVAASQAWFEYQPARVRKAGGASLERFEAPAVKDAPIRALRRRRASARSPTTCARSAASSRYRTPALGPASWTC